MNNCEVCYEHAFLTILKVDFNGCLIDLKVCSDCELGIKIMEQNDKRNRCDI